MALVGRCPMSSHGAPVRSRSRGAAKRRHPRPKSCVVLEHRGSSDLPHGWATSTVISLWSPETTPLPTPSSRHTSEEDGTLPGWMCLWPAVRDSTPSSFLCQTGALSQVRTCPRLRPVAAAPLVGRGPLSTESAAARCVLHGHPLEATTSVCTRPGVILESKGGLILTVRKCPHQRPSAVVEVTRCNVDAALDEQVCSKSPCVS